MAAAIPAVAAWGESPQARNSEAAHEALLENLIAFVRRMAYLQEGAIPFWNSARNRKGRYSISEQRPRNRKGRYSVLE